MYSTKNNNKERSEIIPITNTYSKKFNKNKYDEYGLKQNFFDPSKSSPPNNFIIKLQTRMNSFHFIKNEIN